MLLVDANVLVNAVNADAVEHSAARGWLRQALASVETVAFSWTVLVGFVRIATHPGILDVPLTTDDAVAVAERWLAAPAAVVLEPTSRHLALLRGLLEGRPGGNVVNDAHLAALALEHGATVVSFDRDFAGFEGLKLLRPSAA